MTEPVDVVIFSCNWDGLSCIEAAAHERLCYPTSVRVVRVSCLSRVHLGLVLRAFELGADGVMLLGCEPGQCHYDIDPKYIDQEYGKTQAVLRLMGLGSERLILARLHRGNGAEFIEQVNSFVSQLGHLWPPAPVAVVSEKQAKPPSPWDFRTEG
jgi:F420-non-reducing hydrogenase iron-sulfur subunit